MNGSETGLTDAIDQGRLAAPARLDVVVGVLHLAQAGAMIAPSEIAPPTSGPDRRVAKQVP